MSNKIANSNPDLSTEVVDKKTGQVITIPRYVQPVLNRAGMEMPSAITLVAVPAARDFDMGHRIRRYQRAPDSVQARYDAEAYGPDDDDFDNHVDSDDVNPMTPHELRFADVQTSYSDHQKEQIKLRDERKAQKLLDDKKAFQAQYKTLLEEGSIPATPPPPLPPKGA